MTAVRNEVLSVQLIDCPFARYGTLVHIIKGKEMKSTGGTWPTRAAVDNYFG
jgi:hypothetical protein